jgi:ABC-type bacteriocin/lantibiotic exporter with double-glycine peptidase domain
MRMQLFFNGEMLNMCIYRCAITVVVVLNNSLAVSGQHPNAAMAVREDPSAKRHETQYECNTISLYMFYKINCIDIDINMIEGLLPPSTARGRNMEALVNASRTLGLPLEAVRFGPNEPIQEPSIILVRRSEHGHFVVVRPVGRSGKLLQVLDGYAAPRIVEATRVYQSPQWTGLALVMPRRLSRLLFYTTVIIIFGILMLLYVATWRISRACYVLHWKRGPPCEASAC